MMPRDNILSTSISILLVADAGERSVASRQFVNMALPHASITPLDMAAVAEHAIPAVDVALLVSGDTSRATIDALRFLRARGFSSAIVVITGSDDATLRATAQSLGARCITWSTLGDSPVELGAVLTASLEEGAPALAEVAQARRIFAAGQAALSLQHSINNPLAALLAEAQLLQLEELTKEQRDSVERIIELCRRIVGLVRRLDVLATR